MEEYTTRTPYDNGQLYSINHQKVISWTERVVNNTVQEVTGHRARENIKAYRRD